MFGKDHPFLYDATDGTEIVVLDWGRRFSGANEPCPWLAVLFRHPDKILGGALAGCPGEQLVRKLRVTLIFAVQGNLSVTSTEEMMEFLFDRRTPDLPPRGLAEIFERLLWCMDDNGTEVAHVCRKWLAGENEAKVRIALAMTELFPAESRDEMTELFAKITSRWPGLKDICDSWLAAWDEQMKGKP